MISPVYKYTCTDTHQHKCTYTRTEGSGQSTALQTSNFLVHIWPIPAIVGLFSLLGVSSQSHVLNVMIALRLSNSRQRKYTHPIINFEYGYRTNCFWKLICDHLSIIYTMFKTSWKMDMFSICLGRVWCGFIYWSQYHCDTLMFIKLDMLHSWRKFC